MKLRSKSVTALAVLAFCIHPTSAGANSPHQNASMKITKVLADHPGAATALTLKQKSEIREILAKGIGNRNIICTGTSLAGQRESMYPIVLLRAQLVCEYAKLIDPSIKTTVKERFTTLGKLNGRVEFVSK